MTADTRQAETNRILLTRNTLVVLIGPAGCGKSTFAARNFRPTEVVSSDECRALISDDPANQRVSVHAFELMHLIVEKRLTLGRLTVCDATNLEAAARRPLVKRAKRYGSEVVGIVFDVPLEVCIRRNAGRRRVVPLGALLSQYEMFDKAKKALDNEGFDRIFTLNQRSQSRTIVEPIRTAKQRLVKKR